MSEKHLIRLPDGRQLCYAMFGAPLDVGTTTVVLAFHSTPGSRLKYRPADDDARVRNTTLIAIDRWAYGGTDAPADRAQQTLSNFADDIAVLLDELGITHLRCVGISGGGPYAAAIAAKFGTRVRRASLVAPVGLIRVVGEDGKPRTVPLSWFHQLCFRGIARSPATTSAVFSAYKALLAVRGRAAIATAMAKSGPADRKLLDAPGVVDNLTDMMREGLSPGTKGPAIDLDIFGRPWDIDPRTISARTQLWFGDQDGSVPETAINALCDQIPNAKTVHLKDQGHFWIATRFPEVLDWLISDDE
ncbi:MAG: alpha/beta hydrolase, partial [Pseudomonadota bacterium]